MDSLITAEKHCTVISSEKSKKKKQNRKTCCQSFIWLTGWLAEEKEKDRQRTKRNDRNRGFCVCVCARALTPLRNDLWQESKFDFFLHVNVTGPENSWHSFRHCTPSAYHHPTLPNGNDTQPIEWHMGASKVCARVCVCLCLYKQRHCWPAFLPHSYYPVCVMGSEVL